MESRLVVFGATGDTGSEVARQARAAGFEVRAAARSLERLDPELVDHPRCTPVCVDVADGAAVDGAIAGCSQVFAALGYKGPREPLLLPFVVQVVQSMREHGAHRFVYQASAMNSAPGQPSGIQVRLLRPLIGAVIGTQAIWSEHDAVLRFLAGVSDLAWTVTRPGRLVAGESAGTLEPSEGPGGGVRYVDLAAFVLRALEGRYVREAPYLRYAR